MIFTDTERDDITMIRVFILQFHLLLIIDNKSLQTTKISSDNKYIVNDI